MTELRWVGQEDAEGCCLAVAAMLLGRSYVDVRELVDSWSDKPHDWATRGVTFHTMDRILAHGGYYIRRLYEGWNLDPWPPKPFAPLHYASVVQPSRHNHFVAVDSEGRVFDPLREGTFSLTDWSKVNQVVGVALPHPTTELMEEGV